MNAGNTGKSIVFVHGSGCNGALWAHQSQHFASGYQVVAPDLPGHGRNEGKRCKSIGEFADFVLSEIDRLGLHLPAIVGHSLGGAVALQLALDTPERLGAIVLAGTGARLRVSASLLDLLQADHAAALDAIAQHAFSGSTPRSLVDRAMCETRKVSTQVLLDDFLACDKFDVMQRLEEIALPTLVVVGRDDTMTPVKYSEYLNAHIANSRLEIVDDAGHMVMIEQPDRFNATVESFLISVFAGRA